MGCLRFFHVLSALFEMLSALLEMLSASFDVLSASFEALSALFDVLCALFDVLSALFDVLSALFDVLSALFVVAQVSVDSRVRELINCNMASPTTQIFEEAQMQIFTLMQRDSYPRFLNSQVYKRLLQ